ncbi:MAG: DNA topoisomerase [Legionellaceae bacterium]|nr:DNA topoisomerase [Legionellaceae bacterium]HAF87757.1 DNA topoisomerase [Legionellales bacterium]|tara:strand:- start:647 stop:1690 length:1044 start_codon:yes stop_codon:yes gene_type:complete
MAGSLYTVDECEKVALDAALRYVNDTLPGISRKRAGKGFAYYTAAKVLIKDKTELKRIKALGIPPAYQNVWICPYANGHIQATGRDAKNRKQYRYHERWHLVRQESKFANMLQFGEALPMIRTHIKEQLAQSVKLSKSQVICAMLYLLDTCYIRIGNPHYAKENASYGLTTLRKKHLTLTRHQAQLEFKGKSAQLWQVVLKNNRILKIIKQCEDIPGFELFKYLDEEHNAHVIQSQDINHYLQSLTNQPFTAKDFRTWAACRETLKRCIELTYEGKAACKTTFKLIVAEVAKLLRHTPSICRKNYIHQNLILAWQEARFSAWLERHQPFLPQNNDDAYLLYWLNHQD